MATKTATTPRVTYAWIDKNGLEHGPFPSWNHANIARGSLGGTITKLGADGKPISLTVVSTGPAPAHEETPKSAPKSATSRTETKAETRERQLASLADIAPGLAKHTTFFDPGTPLYEEGHETFRGYERDWEKSLPVEDVCHAIASRIDAEERVDVVVDLAELRALPDGTFTRGKAAFPMEPHAFSQFVARAKDVFPRGQELLLAMDLDLRATVINRQLRKLGRKYATARLRRGASGGLQFFAICGPQWDSSMDANHTLRAVAEAVEGEGLRGSGTYNPGTSDVTITGTWHAPHAIDPHVGDIFEVGFKGRTNDAAGGALDFDFLSKMVRCRNCSVSTAYAEMIRRIHRGEMTGVREQVRADLRKLPAAFEVFARDWNILRKAKIGTVALYGQSYESVTAAIEGLVNDGRIDVAMGRDALVEMLLTAHAKEVEEAPDDRVASILDAITRAAADALVAECVRDQLQRASGVLVPVFAEMVGEA